MPVQRAAPGVEHGEEAALHPPVVFLEKPERLGGGGEQHVAGDPVVELEELVDLLGHGEHDVEMRAVRQPFTDLFRPFGLAGSEAVRAVAVAAGAGVPFLVVAVLGTGRG